MAPNITLPLAYLTGRASGVPLEASTVSRYLRLPQIIVAHCLIAGALRLRGRRFESDLSHRLAFEIGRHRSSGPGWFAGGTFDRSVTRYQASSQLQVELECSSDVYAARLWLQGRMIASVQHDGKKFESWIDPAVPHDLPPEIDQIFLRYVNPWLLSGSEEYAAFEKRTQQIEAELIEALDEEKVGRLAF